MIWEVFYLVHLLGVVLSILVYTDMFWVIKKKAHLFTPAMFLISEKQRRVYRGMYEDSLKRQMFCVMDKIEVSGYPFLYYLFASQVIQVFGLFDFFFSSYLGELQSYMLWIQGLPVICMSLVALQYYRTTQEMCFYCKYTILIGNIQTGILQALLSFSNKTTWPFVVTIGCFAVCVMMISEATRSANKQAQKERQRKKELQKQKKEQDSGYDKSISSKQRLYQEERTKLIKEEEQKQAQKRQELAEIQERKKAEEVREQLNRQSQLNVIDEEQNDEEVEEIECPGHENELKNRMRTGRLRF